MKDKRLYSWIIIAILILSFAIFLVVAKKNEQRNHEKTGYNIFITTDYSTFFTVSNCANKYISYISNNDVSRILNVLNKDYIKENNIDSNNLYNFISIGNDINGNVIYKIEKMYQKKYSKYYNRFYTKGSLYIETPNGNTRLSNYYLILNIDSDNMTFDVTPFNSQEFKELIHETN